MTELCRGGRQTGRTEFMLNELVESIVEGQPKSILIGRDHHHVSDLAQRLLRKLLTRFPEEAITAPRPNLIMVDESMVVLETIDDDRKYGLGRGFGKFYDHWALGEE